VLGKVKVKAVTHSRFKRGFQPYARNATHERKVLRKERNVRKKWPMTGLEFITWYMAYVNLEHCSISLARHVLDLVFLALRAWGWNHAIAWSLELIPVSWQSTTQVTESSTRRLLSLNCRYFSPGTACITVLGRYQIILHYCWVTEAHRCKYLRRIRRETWVRYGS